jgi:hypothetical protein
MNSASPNTEPTGTSPCTTRGSSRATPRRPGQRLPPARPCGGQSRRTLVHLHEVSDDLHTGEDVGQLRTGHLPGVARSHPAGQVIGWLPGYRAAAAGEAPAERAYDVACLLPGQGVSRYGFLHGEVLLGDGCQGPARVRIHAAGPLSVREPNSGANRPGCGWRTVDGSGFGRSGGHRDPDRCGGLRRGQP